MAEQLPSGTVTFLFTDIEGSAALAQEHPQALPALLARHHALLRQSIAAHQGHVFQIIGDAFCAAFHTAADGVNAALDAQRALQREAWVPAPIRVRMGLHTGSAQATGAAHNDGDVYTGYLTLTRVQRIMSVAQGGQVLLSDATARLVAGELPGGELPAGVSLRDLGEHRLKSLLQAEKLWQLDAPGLRQDFPATPSLKRLPHNLPLQLTSFIGRERELDEVKQLLAANRLLTLTGPGGTGKTRLALQAAGEALESFAEGVWMIELAPLANPALLAQTVAAAWGVREQPGRPLIDTLLDYLRGKNLLLILDNCEHLLPACAEVAAALLGGCPKLKVMSSSREAMGIAGETAYRVPSLSLPDPDQPLSVERHAQSEAVRLFVERAQAAQPRFALTAHNAGVIAQICRRLDGIPLALELAAARVRLLSVDQIAERIDDRFRLLTGGSRTALPRQQTLRALIDWSYDLLPAAERGALARLSVFAGGWSFEAAEAVLGPDALDLLSHLVDKSLVVVDELIDAGDARYRLLETIRQYARDKLLEAGEAPAVRDLHARHYQGLAEAAEPKLVGPDLLPALNQLELEIDNLRAALEWALDRSPVDALRLAAGLTYFWQRRGRLLEGRRWLRDSLARFDALPAATGDAARERLALRAKSLWAAGDMAFSHGELNVSRSHLEESAALARAAEAPEILIRALGALGFTTIWLGDAAATEAVIDEGQRVARAVTNRRALATLLGVQAALAARLRGDFAAAQGYSQQAVPLVRDQGNPWDTASMLMGLATMELLQGHLAVAQAHLAESESLFRQMGDRLMTNGAVSEQAHIERQLGHYQEAIALYAQTIAGWQELGHRAALAHELECCAYIAGAQAQPRRAAQLLGAAEVLRASANAPMADNERAEYEQNLSALRALLDAPALEAAWSEGRAMPLDDAIACALSPAPEN